MMPFATPDKPLYAAKAELSRALGNPARIRILEVLVVAEQSVSARMAELELESSALSKHLAVLSRNGLVESSRKGNAVTQRLTDPSVAPSFAAARAVLTSTLGRSRQVLEELEGSR
jgi:ArsR family transcriptional regulator